MTKTNITTQQVIAPKQDRLNKLGDLYEMIKVAILGEEPQMRKELIDLKHKVEIEMKSLNAEIAELKSKMV